MCNPFTDAFIGNNVKLEGEKLELESDIIIFPSSSNRHSWETKTCKKGETIPKETSHLDLAILKVKPGQERSLKVFPARLNKGESATINYKPVYLLAGFGSTDESPTIGVKNIAILALSKPLQKCTNCRNTHESSIQDTFGFVDSCKGDSGGAVFIMLASGELVLYGIISRSLDGTYDCGQGTIFTRISPKLLELLDKL